MSLSSITLFPHQIKAFRDILAKADKYSKEADEYLPGASKAHCMDEVRRQHNQLISAIKRLVFDGKDITCRGKTVGEVASVYNLHVYKGGFVDNNSDSLYSGNLSGNEIVENILKIDDHSHIFLTLEDGRIAVIVGAK